MSLLIVAAKLAGRCTSGEERGQGSWIHALKNAVIHEVSREVHGEALCKAKPGRRSVGWTLLDTHVTCPRCLRAIERAERTI